jgi:hypothetical protein
MFLHVAIGIDLYLLVGALFMLGINELVGGCVTPKEFILGCFAWPIVALVFSGSLVLQLCQGRADGK